MAAEATDRAWSSTRVLGAYQEPAAAAPQTRETRRCHCCPYGYHIDVDFLNYLNAIKAGSGLTKLRKIHGHRLRQRQAMETQLLMIRPPTSTPPPLGQRLGSDSGGTDLSESSGSSSPITPWSQSEDERDSAQTALAAERHLLMADLDASIADALNSIEALIQPRRSRTTESSYDNTAMTGTTAAGYRSISTGDVRWTSSGSSGQTSEIMQLPRDPPSPLSSVSCSTLHDDSTNVASWTPEVFQPVSTQSFSIDVRAGDVDPKSHSSTGAEPRSQSETTGISTTVTTTTVFQQSSKLLPTSSAGVPTTAKKSYASRPPVKPRSASSVSISRDHPSVDSARERSLSASADTGTDSARRLPTGGEILLKRDPTVDEKRETAQHSTVSDSNISVQTTSATTSLSVSTTTTVFTGGSAPGRQLPALPRPTEPDPSSTGTSKESSFSSVRALLNRKCGGYQRPSGAKVDRPVRRSRQQVVETVQTKITSGDVISAPVASLTDETASAVNHSSTATEQHVQYSTNESTRTTATSMYGTVLHAESEESITASSCSSPTEVAEVETTKQQYPVRPSSMSRDQTDQDSLEVSFEELAKAMAILSPVVERSQDGVDAKFDQSESSVPPAINPDVLMTIRKYIASSLQQMRMLEQQVKLIPVLQLRVSVLKEDKRLLKLQLQKAKNGSGTPTSKADACVGVTLSELPVARKEKDLGMRLERSSLPDQLPVECRDVGVGESSVEINTDSRLRCPRCNSSLRQHSSNSLQKSERQSEDVGYPSVSLLISKLQGEDKNDLPPTRRSWSVEKATHGSLTSPEADATCTFAGESGDFAAVRRPKPPVPRKEISISRVEGQNRSTVGIQCTLLKDNKEENQDSGREILPSELDTVNKHIARERADFRAREPDLVTTHCLGVLPQNEHEIRPTAVGHLQTFADKEIETDRTCQSSVAVNTVSCTAEDILFKFSSVETQRPAQTIHCSINTDISGDIWSAAEYHVSRSTGEDSTVKYEVVQPPIRKDFGHSVKDELCSVDTVRKPATSDASSWTDESLLRSLILDISKLQYPAEVKPFVKDVECLADIRASDAKDAFCQTDTEKKPMTYEVACGYSPAVESVDHPQLTNSELLADGRQGPPSNLVDVACGSDDVNIAVSTSVPNVTDAACNTEIKVSRDVECNTDEDRQPTKHVSCLADIKLSVYDKSSSTVPVTEFVDEKVKADERLTSQQSGDETLISSDMACLTDSLTTREMSTNTEVCATAFDSLPADARLSTTIEAGCLTEILWKPHTNEVGCNTDIAISSVESTLLSNMVAVPSAEEALALRPHSTSVALNTDAWLLTSDLTFLDTLKQMLRPSVIESATMTDAGEKLQTSDASTSTMKRPTSECSTNTDAELKPSVVDVESLAQPAVCEVGSNTEVEDKKRQVRDAASSVDIVLRPSASDASVNTDTEAGHLVTKSSRSVASNTDTTVHPIATGAASSVSSVPSSLMIKLASGATLDLPDLKDASSATDSLDVCHVSVGTEAITKPANADAVAQTEQTTSVVRESWSYMYGADTVERRDKEVTAKADTMEVACDVALRPQLRSISCGIDAEVVSHHESYLDSVSDAADLQSVDHITDALYDKGIPSEIRGSNIVAHLHDAETPVFRETREVACNTENIPMQWVFDDMSHPSGDADASKDFSTVSTVYWTNDEGAKICRLCGVQNVSAPSVSIGSFTDISCQLISPHENEERPSRILSGEAGFVADQSRANEAPGVDRTDLPDDAVEDNTAAWRTVGVGIRPETKDIGCDAEQILTTDMAIKTDFCIESKQETFEAAAASDFRQVYSALGSQETASMTDPLQPPESFPVKTTKDVACGTSDVILPTSEDVCISDKARILVDNAVQAKSVDAVAVLDSTSAADESVLTETKCPTCLAKPATRDISCGTDALTLSDGLRHSATDHVESTIPSRAVSEVGCNTDWCQMIQSTAEAACNTEIRTPTCDVGLNTEAVTDVARKPSRIPHISGAATRRPDKPVARPVTKDAVCITDIVIAPSDETEVLRKMDKIEPSEAVSLPSTAEVACNTDVVNIVESSISVGGKKLGPAVRTVGCGAHLTLDTKPSNRDAECTARPETRSRSSATDPVPLAPVTETPVKAVERTKTGLQVTRRVKSQPVTTTRPTDTLSTPTTPNAPVIAAAKSPTFDVACGTDVEFNSKYFNMDDSGLLRQLSADDVAEVLRRRGGSSSLSSPTCDVACNTEYDSRPCTPARVNYSNYYAGAAVDPMPPTAADVACGPDTPSPVLCDVGCGTEELGNGSYSLGSPTLTGSPDHRRTERRVLPLAPTDNEHVSFQQQSEVKRGSPTDAAVETKRSPLSQDQACDTSDLPETFSQPQLHLELSATMKPNEETPVADMKPEKSKYEESHTTSTAVGDFDVREELLLRSHTARNSTEGQASALRRNLRLDFGLVSGARVAGEQIASRHEDLNNNDDEQHADEFQTYSSDSRQDGEQRSPTRPAVEARHDVKFIDDDDDSESDGVDQKESDGRMTMNVAVDDDDMGSPSMAADLGRRWGTVDLIPKPTAISPLLSPNAAPLKSIMKSPILSSDKTLSKNKKGISFSQDTVFK